MNQELIAKYLSGNCTEEEAKALLNWVESSEENRQYFSGLKNTWAVAAMDDIQEDDPRIQKQYDILLQKINPKEIQLKNPQNGRLKTWLQPLQRMAASILLTIGITACISYFIWHTSPPQVTYNELVVPCGQQAQLTLADGTRIWLNSKSKLKYPGTFTGKIREVFLEGEGYFNVSHNPRFPFVVKTSHVDVKVLGTAFNVSCYSDDNEIKLALETGSVNIIEKQNHNRVTAVKPDELASYSKNKKSVEVTHTETSLYTSWRIGQFKFRKMSFDEISRRLGRNFNMEFVFANPTLRQIKYSGSFYNYESLDQILKIMQVNTAFKYKIKLNKVYIE